MNPSEIAQRVRPSRTTVSRILSDARDLHVDEPLQGPGEEGRNESAETMPSESEAAQ
jgi:hypothetical protein